MYHWRDKSFQALTEAANQAAAVPAWNEYAEFCSLLEKGLRKDALNHLAAFIGMAAKWSFPEKKRFVSWLYHFAHEHPDSFLLIPQPLYKDFLHPALFEWAEREPENGEPHRWLGGSEYLKKAIQLDPSDEIARRRLVETTLLGVSYSIHELPDYGYLGNPEEDLKELAEIEKEFYGISDEEERLKYQNTIERQRAVINAYLSGKAET